MARQNKNFVWAIAVLIIVIAIVFYIVSLGNYKGNYFRNQSNELKESLEKARVRHRKLEALINKKLNLKRKLLKRFKWAYFSVRCILVGLWGTSLLVLFKLGLVTNLGDALNYSNAFVLILITANFITFGSITNLNAFLNALNTRVENWVYGKYVSLDEKIEVDNSKLEETKNSIEGIQ